MAQNAARVAVPVRMGRIADPPFSLLRGAATVMTRDLAALPRTGLGVMACGDRHLANFGLFASARRCLIFAIHDFDEIHPGRQERDIKRLLASAAVAARYTSGAAPTVREAAEAAARAEMRRTGGHAGIGLLRTRYDRIDAATILAAVPASLAARTRRPIILRETDLTGGSPLPVAVDPRLTACRASLPQDPAHLLQRDRITDVARKVVGAGSVDTRCGVILTEREAAGACQVGPLRQNRCPAKCAGGRSLAVCTPDRSGSRPDFLRGDQRRPGCGDAAGLTCRVTASAA